jgi:hypothetical protein
MSNSIFGKLHINRQVDQDRTGTTRLHDVERLLEDIRHQCRFHDRDRPLGDRGCDLGDIDCLKVFLVEARTWRLPRDAKDRNGIGRSRIETRDHVRPRRAGRTDAQADITMLGTGIAFGHMRSAFDMTRQYVADRAARFHRRIKWIDRCARHTESTIDPFSFQHKHGCIDCTHSGHDGSSYGIYLHLRTLLL